MHVSLWIIPLLDRIEASEKRCVNIGKDPLCYQSSSESICPRKNVRAPELLERHGSVIRIADSAQWLRPRREAGEILRVAEVSSQFSD